ncbi:MAG: hypothetical protein CMJ36_00155 [Phycisphaerae bacterium]|nr:hypothetical protein [Phycisphaerae bacterium]
MIGSLAGCSTTSTGLAQSTLDGIRGGDPTAPGLILDWNDAFQPVTGKRTFDIVAGTNAKQQVQITTTAGKKSNWTVEIKDRETFAWSMTDEGIVSGSTMDDPSGTTSVFTPRLPVIPRSLEPGKALKSNGAIKVVKTKDPSHEVASGTWAISITHDADVTLKVGDEELHCVRLHTVYTADLGLARVSRDTYDYYAPKHGLVATVYNQEIIKVIIPEKTSGTWVAK